MISKLISPRRQTTTVVIHKLEVPGQLVSAAMDNDGGTFEIIPWNGQWLLEPVDHIGDIMIWSSGSWALR